MAPRKKEDDSLKVLMEAMSSLASSVKTLTEEVKELKEHKQSDEAPAELRDDVRIQLEQRVNHHKVQSYKVMAYEEDRDLMGNIIKIYSIPGTNFPSLEKAKEYVEKNPSRKFDIIPL